MGIIGLFWTHFINFIAFYVHFMGILHIWGEYGSFWTQMWVNVGNLGVFCMILGIFVTFYPIFTIILWQFYLINHLPHQEQYHVVGTSLGSQRALPTTKLSADWAITTTFIYKCYYKIWQRREQSESRLQLGRAMLEPEGLWFYYNHTFIFVKKGIKLIPLRFATFVHSLRFATFVHSLQIYL